MKFRQVTFIVLVVCTLLMLILGFRSEQGVNIYVRQAESFLAWRLDIPTFYHDLAVYNGRFFLPMPIFPAVVLMPGVWFSGASNALPIVSAVLLTVPTVFVFRAILRHLEIDSDTAFWTTTAFICGTGYWYCIMASWGAWFFAHIVATLCLVLAMYEALVARRAASSGLLMGLGYLSRPLMVFPAFFLIAALWHGRRESGRGAQVAAVFWFALLAGLCVGAEMLLNWSRFDDPLQSGYLLVPNLDILKIRIEAHGLFSLAYLPFNVVYMFLQGPHIEFNSPGALRDLSMDQFGTSLTFASPFLIAAFFARWDRLLIVGAWLSIAATLGTLLVYFNNGFVQVNFQRYALDTIPIMMVLVALGARRLPVVVWRGSVIYAVALNVIATVGIAAEQTAERLLIGH